MRIFEPVGWLIQERVYNGSCVVAWVLEDDVTCRAGGAYDLAVTGFGRGVYR